MEYRGFGDEEWQERAANNAQRGRRPSRPGAPMAPERGGLTDPLVWANQFRRNDSQLTELPPVQTAATAATSTIAAPARSTAPQLASITSSVLDEIMSRAGNAPISLDTNPGMFTASAPQGQPAASPSLTRLAAGGMNFAQQWMESASRGQQAGSQYMDKSQPAYTSVNGRRPDGSIIRDKIDSVKVFRGGTSAPLLGPTRSLNPLNPPKSRVKRIEGIESLSPIASRDDRMFGWGSAFS